MSQENREVKTPLYAWVIVAVAYLAVFDGGVLLNKASPTLPIIRDAFSVSLGKAAEANLRSGQMTLARRQSGESLDILDKLVAADPDWFDAAADLAAIVFTLAEIEREDGQAAKAEEHYRRTVSILRELESKGMLSPRSKYRGILALAEQRLR